MKSTADTPNRIEDKEWVESTYSLSEFGDPDYKFYTLYGTLIAIGYRRIVYGDHGPYIELIPENLIENAWKGVIDKGQHAWYNERYPKDGSNCKLYIQKYTVKTIPNPPKGKRSCNNNRADGYADYLVDKLYISPEDIQKPDDNILFNL